MCCAFVTATAHLCCFLEWQPRTLPPQPVTASQQARYAPDVCIQMFYFQQFSTPGKGKS